jgi:hypothetical protein
MTQNIFTGTVYPVANPVLRCVTNNVGIIKRMLVEVVATVNNNGGAVATLTDTGIANLLSNVTFYDLSNNLRINTTGLHLALLASLKRHRPFAATAQYNTANGNNVSDMFNVAPALWPVLQAPQTIAAGANGTIRAVFEVPLAYSDDDLRGAMFASVVNSTANLQLTFNPNLFTAAGDTTFAVYSGSTGVFTSAVVNVYQVYLDQLPINPRTGQYILPTESLGTIYELKNTQLTAVSVNQDFSIPFGNMRNFFSALLIYNNNGTAAGRALGTDINYFSRTTANVTNVFKYDPLYNAMLTRQALGKDLPAGAYYFNFRKQPINTNQYGNQQINLNASVATADAYVQCMWEDMASQTIVPVAASLP